jgi:biotin carboxylase
MNEIVIVAGARSYRTGDFLEAATTLRARVTLVTDVASPVAGDARVVQVDFDRPDRAAAEIAAAVPGAAAVVPVDDAGVRVAARAAAMLGLEHSPPEAVDATRDKLAMRGHLAAAAVPQPRFAAAAPGEVAARAEQLGPPVVVKPTGLAAGRGVVRLDDLQAASATERRVRGIVARAGGRPDRPLLVEEYVPGSEFAVEGLLVGGDLQALAVIDKPVALEGPFFEETLFVTPSRQPAAVQEALVAVTAEAVTALGLTAGPVHAELRLSADGTPRLIEIAARTIGGLCGRALTFGLLGESLEVLVLRGALGLPAVDTSPALPASGALMLPIPVSGVLGGVSGVAAARSLPGVTEVTITAGPGSLVEPLPEGDRYLGFVIAAGEEPDVVEATLRRAAATLVATIDGEEVPLTIPAAAS